MRVFGIALFAAVLWSPGASHGQVNPRVALLERDGFLLLNAGEARRAAEAFREALEADPKHARLHLGAGIAAYLDRRDLDAISALGRALVLDPALAEARRYLGLALRRRGDLPGAIRVYEALRDRGAAETLARWQRELELHDRMRRAVGERFTVSFEGPAEESLAGRALESLDRAYWRLGDLLGATYPLSAVSVVLYTRDEFRDITRAPAWAAGAYDGIIRVPVRGALDQPAELDRVLAHEFTHALVRTLAATGVPTWLNEGLAAVLESDSLEWADERLRKSGGSMPLDRLTASFGRFGGADAELAYASSAVAVRRMLDHAGGYAMANLLRDIGDGMDFETAFERRMLRSFTEFSASLSRSGPQI